MTSRAAGDLAATFDQRGDAAAPAVLVLHGWPDDASTGDAVAPALASSGGHVIVPTLRGFGQTRFLSEATPRTGNPGILAMDVIALLDALAIGKVVVVGDDRLEPRRGAGGRLARPDRTHRSAVDLAAPRRHADAIVRAGAARLVFWFMATGRCAQAIPADSRGFAHIHSGACP